MSDPQNDNGSKPIQKIISSIVMIGFFLILLRITRFGGFLFFPLIFIGILPLLQSLKKIKFNSKGNKDFPIRNISPDRQLSSEKQILRVAKEEDGMVTPTIITLKADIPLEEASRLLDEMVKKGYATIYVSDDGRVKYEFPDFKKP